MALPTPVPGLVIRYSYLWHREQLQGREEGQKDRPCAVVAAIRANEAGNLRVLVLPITHRPPNEADRAIELPATVKRRLGLDEAASWVIVSEANEFVWPGPDLRRVPGTDNASVAYGTLPPALFATVREHLLALIQKGGLRRVRRT